MTASKDALRSIARPNGRDWILVGTKVDLAPEPAPSEPEGPCAWYVVMTNPRCEHRVQSGLIDKGFACYLPQYRDERIIPRKGVRKVFDRMLFPRYLFVSAPHGSWPRITNTDGVQGLVRNCFGMPMTVTPMAIQILLDGQASGEFDCMLGHDGTRIPRRQAAKLKHVFDPGSRVKIKAGHFASFFGTVIEALVGNQAKILVELFGRLTPLEIELDHLAAA